MSLHMPEAARIPHELDLDVDRDLIAADAFGEADHTAILSDDPEGWRTALLALMQDTDAELAEVNSTLSGLRYPSQRRVPAQRRAELVDQKGALVTRLRYVKTLTAGPRSVPSTIAIETYEGNKFEQAQAHLRAANRLLKEWAAEHTESGEA